jgi:hypothetical protein
MISLKNKFAEILLPNMKIIITNDADANLVKLFSDICSKYQFKFKFTREQRDKTEKKLKKDEMQYNYIGKYCRKTLSV